MTTREWHVDGATWTAYAAGRLDPVAQAAVDAHVVSCPACRDGARAQIVSVEPLWEAVHTAIARPRLPVSLRVLRRLGAPEDDLVALAASDDLRLPWAVAVGSSLLCAMVAGLASAHQDAFFLVLAPLVPVLSLVAAYDATDPVRELAGATPYSKLRLALLRTTAALAFALPLTLTVGLVVPGLRPLALVWLLPALGLTGGALLLLTWLTAWTAGGVVALAWALVVVATERTGDVTVLTGPAAQAALAAVGVGCAALLVVRTTTLHTQGVPR